MAERILYLAGAVGVAWAVTFALRSIPFVLFAGKGRELPPAVERFGKIVSPVIIACLIVYSYSALEWKTAWPYLAGALTVALQLWRKNPLASMLAGTVLYMALLGLCGCTSEAVFVQNRDHPILSVTPTGLRFAGEPVTPSEAVERLEEAGIPKSDTVYVLIDDPNVDERALWVFRQNYLSKAGWTRSAWVKPRRAEAGSAAELDTKLEKRKTPFKGRTLEKDPRRRTWHLTEDPGF